MGEFFQVRAKESPAVAEAMKGPIAALDWNKLWFSPGMPEWTIPCDAAPIKEAKGLASKWTCASASGAEALAQFAPADIDGWSTTKLNVFLDALLADNDNGGGTLSSTACERMAECYKFLSANTELRFRFLRLALGAKWDGAKDAAVELATTQGRMKFTRPVYKALKAYDQKLARDTFIRHRSSYHPI